MSEQNLKKNTAITLYPEILEYARSKGNVSKYIEQLIADDRSELDYREKLKEKLFNKINKVLDEVLDD